MDLGHGKGDRIFGVAVLLGAVAYAAAAMQLRTGFMSDPVGSKTFPLLVAGVCAICGAVMVLKPDADPDWPRARTWGALAVAVGVLVGYAYALKPLGFLIPTAIAAGVLSYQIDARPRYALLAGLGLSLGLFALFRFVLGLGLSALPAGLS
ncbi:tripartite tricarboxylate transporter TctB family protein [Jannaschia ovalis]|uniref:Tripartite tricarboxylate transporter TctB family protein n=1 Tax=Jannaschia ovalis TaxID=3038773 RepID=A0ABY8L9A9_9RHOB|nr:tripartite tricarboxylate transporter TctB family protein [Jannaschia sp. GRR-S6-38]WGH77937.1 tripartite tricarboxylate transporter TctB family protein [Jannaschia sp. GRR-S6-38]